MFKSKQSFSKNSLQVHLLTFFAGELTGEDQFGNRYYQEKLLFSKFNRPLRRWILYKGTPEASKIPAEWFGWLHFTHERQLDDREKYAWIKQHQQNMSGTPQAYRPFYQILKPDIAKSLPKRYESWQP
jgi:NADH:ubiquinone oxidoreductase subunit